MGINIYKKIRAKSFFKVIIRPNVAPFVSISFQPRLDKHFLGKLLIAASSFDYPMNDHLIMLCFTL